MTDDDSDILARALADFAECEERERENRAAAEDDIRFARLEEQWPEGVRRQRLAESRPCLVVNKLPTFIRQVVNDSRLNKPSIKVQPQDSVADPATADVISGLIRNIELSSDAEIAYDTAVECAATSGVGYFRINLAYARDDNWDQDIIIERIANPFTVYGDPHSTAADSSDWNVAFVTEMMPKRAFEAAFPDAEPIDWTGKDEDCPSGWREGETVRVAEYWVREEVRRKIVLLSTGEVSSLEDFEKNAAQHSARGVTVVGEPREVSSWRVRQHLLTAKEVLSTTEWAGKFIPIVPVYGDEVNLNGRRHFRSLIRSAKDAQMMFNYWRTVATELVALAPKTPFIGPKGAFKTDAAKWETANSESHAFIEYDGGIPPQRQPFAGVPAGALQEALNASDDMKAIMGLYDASLGARSNETSGVAIRARQREGDVSTFHFIDNLARAIRHAGRVIIDLIPHVYTPGRVIRVLGEAGQAQSVPLGAPAPGAGPVDRIYDLSVGKYDLSVSSGPSFTSRREEAAVQMTELIRAYPAAAPVLGDLLARNLDWPGADEIAARLQKLLPPQLQAAPQGANAAPDPQMLQANAANQQLQQQVMALTQKLQALMQDKSLDQQKLAVDQFRAETERMKAVREVTEPSFVPS
jgi:hypothetical protein